MKNTTKSKGGCSGILLFLLFLVLKLTNQIDWSWWWVTSPLWIGFALTLFITLFILLVIVIYIILKYVFNMPLKSKSILSPIDLKLKQILESINK
jgi:phosphoglycerol transferase MdoB-like AlkP superfamily enzyme